MPNLTVDVSVDVNTENELHPSDETHSVKMKKALNLQGFL